MAFYEDFPQIRIIGWGLSSMRPANPESKHHGYYAYDTNKLYLVDNDLAWAEVGSSSGLVTSVFSRTGDVVATTSDYDASQIDNDSTVTGTQVSDALDWLANNLQSLDGYLTDIADLTLVTGDILYYDGANINRLAIGSNTHVLTISSGLPSWQAPSSGTGDVNGPGSSTDEAVVRWDGTGGDTLQDSLVTISDTGTLVAPIIEITEEDAIVNFNFELTGVGYLNFIRNSFQTFGLRVDAPNIYFDKYNGGVLDYVALEMNSTEIKTRDNLVIEKPTGNPTALSIRSLSVDDVTLLFSTNDTLRWWFNVETTQDNDMFMRRNGGAGGNSFVIDHSAAVFTFYDALNIQSGTPTDNEVLKRDSAGDITSGKVDMDELNTSGTPDGTKFLRDDGTWTSPSGSGDVVGPASATDNAIARFNSTTGKLIQNSGITIDDNNILSLVERYNLPAKSTEPTSPTTGDFYFDDGTNTSSGDPSLRFYDGTGWVDVAGSSSPNTDFADVAGASYSSSSTSFVVVSTDFDLTLVSTGNPIEVSFTGGVMRNSDGTSRLHQIGVRFDDGSTVTDFMTVGGQEVNNAIKLSANFSQLFDMIAGSYTISLIYLNGGGGDSVVLDTANNARFTAIEV